MTVLKSRAGSFPSDILKSSATDSGFPAQEKAGHQTDTAGRALLAGRAGTSHHRVSADLERTNTSRTGFMWKLQLGPHAQLGSQEAMEFTDFSLKYIIPPSLQIALFVCLFGNSKSDPE